MVGCPVLDGLLEEDVEGALERDDVGRVAARDVDARVAEPPEQLVGRVEHEHDPELGEAGTAAGGEAADARATHGSSLAQTGSFGSGALPRLGVRPAVLEA